MAPIIGRYRYICGALLARAKNLVALANPHKIIAVDTFAGGSSFPIEALRLGMSTKAGELNPVAVVALKAAIEWLPLSHEAVMLAAALRAPRIHRFDPLPPLIINNN